MPLVKLLMQDMSCRATKRRLAYCLSFVGLALAQWCKAAILWRKSNNGKARYGIADMYMGSSQLLCLCVIKVLMRLTKVMPLYTFSN